MPKPFKTIQMQIDHLHSVKGIDCQADDWDNLLRLGYFNLVNGYKDPFTTGKDSHGNHRYLPGTTLKQLISLLKFDDFLRATLFGVLTNVERELRSLFAYSFDQNCSHPDGWYNGSNYLPNLRKDVSITISKLLSDVCSSRSEYIDYYLENHERIPTWIMTKAVRFDFFNSFVQLVPQIVIERVAFVYGFNGERDDGVNKRKHILNALYTVKDGTSL